MQKNIIMIILLLLGISVFAQSPEQLALAMPKICEYITPRTVAIRMNIDKKVGFGSGAIISSDGYILTCAHVAEVSPMATVILSSGEEYVAKLVGIDSQQDYALLKIDATDLPYFILGDTSNLVLNQWVIAAGYPGGPYKDCQPSVVLGKVRGLHRRFFIASPMKVYRDTILTDVPIFAGNSGGPLVDSSGTLIGINGAIIVINDLSISIDINLIKKKLNVLKTGKEIKSNIPSWQEILKIFEELEEIFTEEELHKLFKPFKSLSFLFDNLSIPQNYTNLGITCIEQNNQVFVEKVYLNYMGFIAGLKSKDKIVSVNQIPVHNIRQLATLIKDKTKQYFLQVERSGKRYTFFLSYSKKDYSRNNILKRTFSHLKKTISQSIVKLYSNGQQIGYGTIIDQNGSFLTCNHILEKCDIIQAEYQNKMYPATIVGKNGIQDIALLKINQKTIPFKCSKSVNKGEWVITGDVLQVGMVSAVNRAVMQKRNVPNLGLFGMLGTSNKSPIRCYLSVIHHDSDIEENQFGTPLLNAKGELIGINVASFYRGTTFAIPLDMIFSIFLELKQGIEIEVPEIFAPVPPKESTAKKILDYFNNFLQ